MSENKKETKMGQHEFFEYNLPVQASREENGDIHIVNYMPRKERCSELEPLEDYKEGNISDKDFFYGTACNLLNLAVLFIEFAEGQRDSVSYHEEDLDKHFPPTTYANIVKNIKSIVTTVDEYKKLEDQYNKLKDEDSL